MLGICELGLSFRAVSPLRTEGPISFALALDAKTRLQGVGEIVWSEEGGKTGGLKFTSVSPQFRELLRTWLVSESTPKNVGREITPAASLPLDSIGKPRSDIRSTRFEGAEPTAPPQPAEAPPFQVEPTEQIQSEQTAREVEVQVPEPVPPPKIEQETVEVPEPVVRVEPTEPIQPKQTAREVEVQVPEPVPPPKIEQESVEVKPEPIVIVEPERSESLSPEPELRTVAPLPSAQPQAEPIFSLPNFRLPSVLAPPSPAAEKIETPVDTSPIEMPPPAPIPLGTSLPEAPASMPEAVWLETETPPAPPETPFPDFFAEDVVQEPPRLNRAVAAGIISLALAVILAALVLSFRRDVGSALIYLGEKLAGEERKLAVPQQPVVTTAPGPTSQSNTVPAEKSADEPSVQTLDKPVTSQTQPSTTETQTPAANSVNGNSSPSSSLPPNTAQQVQDLPPPGDGGTGTGQKEFEQARAILKGNHRKRDLSFAVYLLWTGVGKGHVPAEVTLADLYARGDGVEKSCVQARTLLEAAVRKGSPEGSRRLDQIRRHGCP